MGVASWDPGGGGSGGGEVQGEGALPTPATRAASCQVQHTHIPLPAKGPGVTANDVPKAPPCEIRGTLIPNILGYVPDIKFNWVSYLHLAARTRPTAGAPGHSLLLNPQYE